MNGKIVLSIKRVNGILGLNLQLEDVLGHLRSIGLDVYPAEENDEARLIVVVPSFRPDLEREIDLIEEVARLNGYDHIPVTMPAGRMICHIPPPASQGNGAVA